MILIEREINGRIFRLVCGSIIEEDVDAIVNPANRELRHGGGVAGLLARAGGPEIQKESDEKSPIETGEAIATTAGALPYKAIIHTVGPVWRGGSADEARLLGKAVQSAMVLADQLQFSALSMPPISTGIFGYPLTPAVKIIVSTIRMSIMGSRHLQRVHLCEYAPEKARDMEATINRLDLMGS